MSDERMINETRLAEVMAHPLRKGGGKSLDEMCVMQAVSYIAGEHWTDHPQCACPVITNFMISWNDSLPSDVDRDRLLKPLIPHIVGTRSTPQVEQRRAYLVLDWLVRVHTPAFLDLVEPLKPYAQALRDLPEITDTADATAAGERVRSARAANAAAWAAAWDAAWAAASPAASAAANAAAWAAASAAASSAACSAAWTGGGAAAWAAARAAASAAANAAAWAAALAGALAGASAAAWDKTHEVLAPTVELLQASAVRLVERMIAEGRSDG